MVKNLEKVSVVVPIYNTGKFVRKCIDSVLNQSYDNIELILINDGSKDNSLEIINSYKDDKKIKIFSHDNHGAAYTRNFGLKKACGKYITFVDSDDYIEKDYIKRYVSHFKKNTDVVLGGYNKEINDKKTSFIPKGCKWDVYRFSATCGKMYRREFLVKNKIEYANTEFLEDVIFNLTCLFKNANYVFLKDSLYNYVYNCNSISNDYGRKESQIVNILASLKYINKIALDNNYKEYKYLINYYMETYLFMVFMCCKKSSYSFLKENVSNFMNWLDDTYPDWNTYINKVKEIDTINKIVILLWKGAYNIKLSNLLLYLYAKVW